MLKLSNTKIWLKPLLILVAVSIGIFGILRGIDFLLIREGVHPFAVLYSTDIGNLTNTLSGLGEVIVAILGIEITVIAIIVQLAANKYSSKIMDLFVGDRFNVAVISLYVITSINTVLVVNTINERSLNYFSITFTLVLIILSLLFVIPHFNYIFNFLRPENFLAYVSRSALNKLENMPGELKGILKTKRKTKEDIDFIGDIALNSVFQGDRAVTILSLTSLREILVDYFTIKSNLPKEWFRITDEEKIDPDFSSYSEFVLSHIEKEKIYLERKILSLYEVIFNNSKTKLRDVASGVLLNTQLITIEAVRWGDKGAIENCLKYFNSYLRASIRDKDPRSAFNTLEHYRIIAEEMLSKFPEIVEKISVYFKYYGQEANKNQVLFILETAAHDLCRINEIAHQKKVGNIKELLDLFLTVDEPAEAGEKELSAKEVSLIGVRIAQVKLAGYYLLHGEEELARVIFRDMQVEPLARIKKIEGIIFGTEQEEFWEVTPRGVNFYYIKPEARSALKQFFAWFQ
ncbi:MAG TPA: DUF2254 family protein [Ignavibacteriaceae bacterium]|jgi:hypothetical protein|nr:DUF2254 family protein [Ignavibacteriaceae bacterium]